MSGGGLLWKAHLAREFLTPERCHILETYNTATDHALSIARARVEPNATTAWHVLWSTRSSVRSSRRAAEPWRSETSLLLRWARATW